MYIYIYIGSLPESLTQGLLVGELLIGGLGVNGFITTTQVMVNASISLNSKHVLTSCETYNSFHRAWQGKEKTMKQG